MYWLKRGNQQRVSQILHQEAENKSEIISIIVNAWQELWEETKKGRRCFGFFPDIEERMGMELEITGGLMHYLTGHGPYRQKLHQMKIVEDNMCHICGVVATPEHIVLRCMETRNIVWEERQLLGETPVTEVLRTPELVTALRELTHKVSNYYKRKYLNGVDRRV